MFSPINSQRILKSIPLPITALVLLVALLTFMFYAPVWAEDGAGSEGGQFPLIVGTSLNPTGTNHDVFEIDVVGDMSQPLLTTFPVWGATYDAANDRVLFTSSSGSSNGDQLWEWPVGGALNNLGTIMDVVGGGAQRIDGLAISGGVLYGSYAGGTAEDGLWTIDMNTLAATLVYPFTNSVSGIDADPNTGNIYGVNDSTTSLVLIDPVGMTMTPVAAYPGAEADVDGLAVSNDGRAYLITDQPGTFYVYNLNTAAYETPLTSPWTSSDTFSGGAYIYTAGPPPQPSIVMTKTVGLDPNTCAASSNLSIPAGGGGTVVGYCYTVMNTGNVTFTTHDLSDSVLGTVFTGTPLDLGPGASAGVIVTSLITQTTTNVATWTAYVDTATWVTATSSATVTQMPPTSVSLSDLSGSTGSSPLALAALVLLLIAFAAVFYRKRIA